MEQKGNGRVKQKKLALVIAAMVLLSSVFWWFQHQGTQDRQVSAYDNTVPVTTVAVRDAAVRDSLTVTGTTEAVRDVDVYSEASGLVRKASAEVGARKQAGDMLFVLENELQQSALKKALAAYDKAALDYRRYLSLQREGAVSFSALESMRLKRDETETDMVAARKQFRDTRIVAPVAGTIARKLVDEGEMVQPGMKVANLVDLSRLRIRFFLGEKDVPGIEPGYPVSVSSDAYPGSVLRGTLATISGKAGKDRTYEAEAVLENPGAEPWRGGLFVRVTLTGKDSRNALVIPRTALAGSFMKPEVYVVQAGKARLRHITAGREYGDQLEILAGLRAGEQVVTNGQNELRDGSAVRVIPQQTPQRSP
jgi:RND family efflux transporter MFP subunit